MAYQANIDPSNLLRSLSRSVNRNERKGQARDARIGNITNAAFGIVGTGLGALVGGKAGAQIGSGLGSLTAQGANAAQGLDLGYNPQQTQQAVSGIISGAASIAGENKEFEATKAAAMPAIQGMIQETDEAIDSLQPSDEDQQLPQQPQPLIEGQQLPQQTQQPPAPSLPAQPPAQAPAPQQVQQQPSEQVLSVSPITGNVSTVPVQQPQAAPQVLPQQAQQPQPGINQIAPQVAPQAQAPTPQAQLSALYAKRDNLTRLASASPRELRRGGNLYSAMGQYKTIAAQGAAQAEAMGKLRDYNRELAKIQFTEAVKLDSDIMKSKIKDGKVAAATFSELPLEKKVDIIGKMNKQESDVRKLMRTETKYFDSVTNATNEFFSMLKDYTNDDGQIDYQRLNDDPDAAAIKDAAVRKYMLALEPGSIVRESEYEQAANTGSTVDSVTARLQKILDGGAITGTQLRKITGVVSDLAENAKSARDGIFSFYDTKVDSINKKYDPFGLALDKRAIFGGFPDVKVEGVGKPIPSEPGFDDLNNPGGK